MASATMKHAHQSKAISSATGRTWQLISENRRTTKCCKEEIYSTTAKSKKYNTSSAKYGRNYSQNVRIWHLFVNSVWKLWHFRQGWLVGKLPFLKLVMLEAYLCLCYISSLQMISVQCRPSCVISVKCRTIFVISEWYTIWCLVSVQHSALWTKSVQYNSMWNKCITWISLFFANGTPQKALTTGIPWFL